MPQPYATTPSDPRRFVRRHRYQEGPGFLFLATQNGRPANEPARPDLREVLQQEVLDRQRSPNFAEAEVALARLVEYYNYHRLSGTLDWLTPAERYNGARFTGRGFENIPALAHPAGLLEELMNALSHICLGISTSCSPG
jgi:hypothetical protein